MISRFMISRPGRLQWSSSVLDGASEMVGVAVGAMVYGQNLNFAIPAAGAQPGDLAGLLRGDLVGVSADEGLKAASAPSRPSPLPELTPPPSVATPGSYPGTSLLRFGHR